MTAIPPVGTTSGSSGSSSSSATSAAGGSLGENDFLKILVSQLKNQDPLNPMDGTAFTAQLAQFSSLEQLIQMNAKLDTQSSATGQATAASQTALAASLIGRTVEASGNEVQVTSASTVSITADVGGTGGTATVKILDSQGNVIATQDLGTVGGGMQTLSWNNDAGDSAELAPGTYAYTLTVTDKSGTAVTVTPYITGQVDGVDMTSSGITLRIGALSVPLGSVVAIEPDPATTAVSSSSLSSQEQPAL